MNKKLSSWLLFIQFILTIATLVFMVMTIINQDFFIILQTILGAGLLSMGINQCFIFNKKKISILYFIFGIGLTVFGILSILGVF